MDEQPLEVVSATDAAEKLGVSASGLRRLGTIYAQVHGELPRERRTEKRIWTSQVVERLGQARALVEAERYRSIKEALKALDKGVDMDVATELATPVQEPTPEALGVLLQEIRSLQDRLEAVDRLEAEVQALRRQLEVPKDTTDSEPGLARMNAYLLGELERRRLEDETKKKQRAWWRFW
jgi:hypothetical protein